MRIIKNFFGFVWFTLAGFIFEFLSLFILIWDFCGSIARMAVRPRTGFILASFFIVFLISRGNRDYLTIIFLFCFAVFQFFYRLWIMYSTQPVEHRKKYFFWGSKEVQKEDENRKV